jgi:hypothetical protein
LGQAAAVQSQELDALAVCGSSLTGAGEPKTWLVRLLRRDCWPEFLEFSLSAADCALSCNAYKPCLSLLLVGKFFSTRLELGIIRDGFRY